MKRLLLVTAVLLSTATCNADAAHITNIRMATRRDQKTSDFSGKQFWWKREKRRSGGQAATAIHSSPEETFFGSGSRPFSQLFESSPVSAAIRYLDANGRRRSQQNEGIKSAGKEYLRYRGASPISLVSTKLGESPEMEKSDFSLRNSKNKCPLPYRRQQSWELQQPFYVEEPSWIEIDSDYVENQPIHRLESIDPFVISRGKKIPGIDRSRSKQGPSTKYENFNASVRDRFLEDPDDEIDNENENDNDDRDGVKSEKQKVSKNTTERREDALASTKILAGQRTKQEILPRLFRGRTNKFQLRNDVARFAENFHRNFPDDPSFVIGRNEAVYRRNERPHSVVETVAAPPNPRRNSKRSNLLDTHEQPYSLSSDKMDARRFGDESNALFERSKSKRHDSDSDSDLDSDSHLSFERFTAKEMLHRWIENLECNLEKCRDDGRTTKRTRLGDGRGTLEDMLTKFDPFYVARGKRASPILDDSFSSMASTSPANDSSTDTIYENGRNF